MPRISSKNQVTLPAAALREAGMEAGEDVIVRVDGPGRLFVESAQGRAKRLIEKYAGSMPPGTWPPGALDELRDEWDR